jgi:hypothetical protein
MMTDQTKHASIKLQCDTIAFIHIRQQRGIACNTKRAHALPDRLPSLSQLRASAAQRLRNRHSA